MPNLLTRGGAAPAERMRMTATTIEQSAGDSSDPVSRKMVSEQKMTTLMPLSCWPATRPQESSSPLRGAVVVSKSSSPPDSRCAVVTDTCGQSGSRLSSGSSNCAEATLDKIETYNAGDQTARGVFQFLPGSRNFFRDGFASEIIHIHTNRWQIKLELDNTVDKHNVW